MKNKHVALLFSIVLLLQWGCGKKQAVMQDADMAKSYSTITVKLDSVELQTKYPTILKGKEDIDIKPRIDGFIDAVLVDEGAVVRKGQPLFKINSPSAIQSVENATALYNTAKLDVERMRPLAEKGIISKVRLSAYENSLASSKASLDQARATLSWTSVTSPVDGVVGSISFRSGSLVNNSSILTTVSNTSTMIAYFTMNEKDLYHYLNSTEGKTQAEKIKNMPLVTLLLADGSTYGLKGRIETISGIVDAASGSVTVRVAFDNPDKLLRSGTSGKLIIPDFVENVFIIPQKATFQQQDKILVYKVQGDSVVQKVIDARSTPDGISYAVFSGIENGDQIVSDGIATLKNGKKIKVKN
ncbi:MAG: efflux RND transporter periplasmic adaptor subunit [Sphingobacteriia bacterium]|nr:efflux RND transporter periplasmic adaptor subunit [Sphingobacteriia bacterium]